MNGESFSYVWLNGTTAVLKPTYRMARWGVCNHLTSEAFCGHSEGPYDVTV